MSEIHSHVRSEKKKCSAENRRAGTRNGRRTAIHAASAMKSSASAEACAWPAAAEGVIVAPTTTPTSMRCSKNTGIALATTGARMSSKIGPKPSTKPE